MVLCFLCMSWTLTIEINNEKILNPEFVASREQREVTSEHMDHKEKDFWWISGASKMTETDSFGSSALTACSSFKRVEEVNKCMFRVGVHVQLLKAFSFWLLPLLVMRERAELVEGCRCHRLIYRDLHYVLLSAVRFVFSDVPQSRHL